MSSEKSEPYRVNGKFASRPVPAPESATTTEQLLADTTPSAMTPTAIDHQLAALTKLISELSAKVDAQGAATASPNAQSPTVPPNPPDTASGNATPDVPPEFTPPATAVTGASQSLRSLFPDIEAAHIVSIISHEFRGSDLFKLDSRY